MEAVTSGGAFSLPWPMRWLAQENVVPGFSAMPGCPGDRAVRRRWRWLRHTMPNATWRNGAAVRGSEQQRRGGQGGDGEKARGDDIEADLALDAAAPDMRRPGLVHRHAEFEEDVGVEERMRAAGEGGAQRLSGGGAAEGRTDREMVHARPVG